MSLVSGILSLATPFVVDRIATAIGINSGLARVALNLAVPAIVSAFTRKAATPEGATALHGAIKKADTDIIRNLDYNLGGARKDGFINTSATTLNGLLGQAVTNEIAGSISNQTGIGKISSSMLLPLAGQLALSGIAKQSPGLDAAGLAAALSGKPVTETAAPAPPKTPSTPLANWLWWLWPIVAFAGYVWFHYGDQLRAMFKAMPK